MDDQNAPATKSDIERLRSHTKADFAQLRSDTKADLAQLRSDTKADLAQLRSDTKADIRELADRVEQLRSSTKADIAESEQRLVETMRDIETKLLQAFYGFAEGTSKHIAQLDVDQAAVRSRLVTLEERLLAVEKRLNMPPAA